jgi:hypothetical protein
MPSRMAVIFAGVMMVFGITNLKQGIRARKTSDIALGTLFILGGGALAAVMVMRIGS